MTVPSFTRARIERLCADALERAGVAGVLPTPLDAVAEAVGVRERVALPPGARVLGALWFERRALFVDGRQSPARRRFTEAHEIAHLLCPWHQAVVRLDTAAELFGDPRAAIEAEANLAASELIFQGGRFAAQAAERERSLRTPLALTRAYGHPATPPRTTTSSATPSRWRCWWPAAGRTRAGASLCGGASSRRPSPAPSDGSPAACGTSPWPIRRWGRRSRRRAGRPSRWRGRSCSVGASSAPRCSTTATATWSS
jgi:hypothetical protein